MSGTLLALGEYGRCHALLGEAEGPARGLDDRARLGRVLAEMVSALGLRGDHDGDLATGRQALEHAVEFATAPCRGMHPLS